MSRRRNTANPPTRVATTLTVCGVSFEVNAYRVSKAVWSAAGQFRGRFVQAKGRTASGAIDAVKSKVEGQEFN
jgi:hypothetical protein